MKRLKIKEGYPEFFLSPHPAYHSLNNPNDCQLSLFCPAINGIDNSVLLSLQEVIRLKDREARRDNAL
jgi:hypothetical protein